ncbi:carboxypeptidase-like regulatory domain-containing protein [Tamlana sp. 2201CG12-4]|uniref:alpha-2-macroglobulin family protein n=1 Tax=Tamlana sp. 2201CG12-4 TaxID=3112582 RepID=UPI002DBE77CE|nr:carboxypeptidase-like regulatory domain-containing protein [Tamlana sp. 2201CG12-4]MEC3906893.1 carboxypeptidase-like regulatory domain-containing protein [Tamlana sp. 2201CG12-4]
MKHCILTLILILFIHTGKAQTNTYDTLWKKVEHYEIEGLVQSALKAVVNIENQAIKDKDHAQQIKTMLYKSKFALILEEDAQLQIINNFKDQITVSAFPIKNVLESILANLYWQYFNQHRWQFYNRTRTSEKVDRSDFRTWDLQTLFNEIHVHYQNSLQNGLMLQQEPLKKYSVLLEEHTGSKIYRPTLFDFLSHNALDFYKTNETHITKPAYKFEIDNPELLTEKLKFAHVNLASKDSTSLQLNALKIYQNLIKAHVHDASPYPMIDADLERLRFINQHAIFNNKEELLLEVLKKEKEQSKAYDFSTLYDFEIAKIYYEQSGKYQPKTNEEYRWKAKEAIDICNTAISKFPESKGAKKCKTLKSQIEQQILHITTEQFLPIQKHARLLVSYKNIDTLQFNMYKLSENQFKRFQKKYRKEEQLAFIEKLDTGKSWVSQLRNENDFQNHTTEVLIPKLNNGRYLIVATLKDNENTFAFTNLQVTNTALVETDTPQYKIFQVINRTNGTPITNANIDLTYYSSQIGNNKTETHTTNTLGELKIIKDNSNYRNAHLKVRSGNDVAYFGQYYINRYYRAHKEDVRHKAFLFTDRSIYRPGQTVYFKAIAIKTKKGKSEVIPNELLYVEVYDVNGDDVIDLELKTNEFGSVSGEFILPATGLNGEYSVELYSDSNRIDIDTEYSFSVEEYKRPKFETTFDPIKETFKVNDSVTVKGNALAYSGSHITDAKVVYRVHRKVQYPRWYFWHRPWVTSEPQEITHGESITNNKGEFEITFKALPDNSIDKSNLPVFKYEVTADVTDLNGETRSATSTINVGYHTLLANLNIGESLNKTKKDHTIHIDTKNLNGEFAPAQGHIKIYKLRAPDIALRPRPWETPDFQDFSKEAFKNLFPHDAYTNEHDSSNWEKGALVFEKPFDTEISKTLKLGKIKKWQSGQYIIILESKDRFGQLVKDQLKTTLFSNDDKVPADSELFTISTDKSTYKIGETAYVTIGSAAQDISVTISVEKDKKVIQTEIIKLSANKKVISIPVTKEDLGGFVVHYSFAAFNSYQSGKQLISVPYPKVKLDIETLTFRDKLQPGVNETWQFKIKGPHGEKVSAELLANMYDASLDQFKPHTWTFNPIQNTVYNAQNRSYAYSSFGINNFRVYNNYQRYSVPQQYYDEWNWFGFNFANHKWANQRYLNTIKIKRATQFHENIKEGFISGTVFDESGHPIPGVTIVIKGTTRGTTTDFDGNFSIKAKKGEELEISFIGYSTHSLKISKNRLNISLTEDSATLDEVVVTAYGTVKKQDLTGSIAKVGAKELKSISANDLEESLEGVIPGVSVSEVPGAPSNILIRGLGSVSGDKKPLYIVDGKIIEGDINLDTTNIQSIAILKDAATTAIYGSRGANGVIIITTKSGLNALAQVKIRKNLKETAFFFPDLRTDESGHISFSFTTPEALTQWKLQLLAHTKALESTTKTLTAITQKELMVVPNVPRFLREGDQITISSKIANLSEKTISGDAVLILTDAISGNSMDSKLGNALNSKSFTVDAKGNTQVSWNLDIPEGIQAIQYKIVAQSEDFSDGEQNALPVLSNRKLVTETLPMWIKSNETKTFTLDKLKNNTSTTLKHHKLTLEMTSNPAWYAVQALPYLMEYPYECNEQTFSRYYANALAGHIANSNPRIQEVFNQWKSQNALTSNLEKNQELKSILIQETPWVRDAQSEAEQKKRIALLFDLNKMNSELQSAIDKLKSNQMASGGWSWFNGGRENRYITQHIINGFGHLKQLGVIQNDSEESIINKAIKYLDIEFVKAYKDIKKYDAKIDLSKDHLNYIQLHYLYMRSFFPDIKKSKEVNDVINYYQAQIQKYWQSRSLYSKGLMALIAYRDNDSETTSKILKSLKETSITSDELGMYWKANTNSWFWYQAPIETQALLIDVFSEAGHVIQNETKNLKTIDDLKIWLLKNKQTSQWKTTKATSEAVYALLLQGSDWLSVTEMVDVVLGNKNIDPTKLENVKVEAGTGYYKTSWAASEVKPEMGEVKLTKKGNGIAWGSLYWQYFEDLDNITSAETPLKLKKKLFLKTNTDTGEEITEITPDTKLSLGDLVRVRIELKSDRNMEFLHMKDMRASGLEPVNVISKYKWQDGLGYYESTKDASTNFFFGYLPKGVYVFEYDLRVNNTGNMSNGITTIQSMYAPEFSSHSNGLRIKIED